MRMILLIAGRELRSFFVSPIAYVVLAGFLLVTGWFFFNLLFRFHHLTTLYSSVQNVQGLQSLNLNEHVIAPLLHNLAIMLLIMVPVRTYELLLTSPLAVPQIVIGKFIGCLTFVGFMLLLTGIYPALLLLYGDPEVGVLVAGYLGLYLLATVFVSVGLFTSSLTENQIIAAVLCFVILLLLYALSWPAQTLGPGLGHILGYLSVVEHFSQMIKGQIDTQSIVYLLSLAVLSLFLTDRSVEASRWR
ncbi:MAG: hypothetical protein HYV04_04895 [Deltaproteobacteria bacterium]|nr:hypothetical protein [Deltaproteobacteria bacterium]